MVITSFEELGLIEPINRALRDEKYEKPTPIQAEAIPYLLGGRDVLGSAQTGTGKTAAFALPILQHLAKGKPGSKKKSPRALILTPTRELADQISRSFKIYGRYLKISHTVVYGGVGIGAQARALARGVDVLVATPGRLLDLVNQGIVYLDRVEFFTLDEADRMLDMGFIIDINKIIAELPEKHQTLFFSATMPAGVKQLTRTLLKDPAQVKINPLSSTAERVDQKVLFVERGDKEALLFSLLEDAGINRALIFTRTKHEANKITEKLNRKKVKAEAIHGNKSQGARTKALKNFTDGQARVLVATDVASRGIDIKGVTHVINYEMPNEPESYIHRVGRTARAGADGIAISFCDGSERAFLGAIERTIKASLPVDKEHPFHSEQAAKSKSRGGSFPGRNSWNSKSKSRKRNNFRRTSASRYN
ncbi:ATP-dependent RNA helicase RhlE [hydrothermal vent metagenome]|uniref:ATP-dependent RNA helicase RhlE n=1 Tax=hydrothermal vent metagenome TaxID=652676 RepID=A0A3B1BLE2_9ZZZZ